jgi:hypothetical protein
MGVQKTIDSVWRSNDNWVRLNLGQLGVLILTSVLHSLNHHKDCHIFISWKRRITTPEIIIFLEW